MAGDRSPLLLEAEAGVPQPSGEALTPRQEQRVPLFLAVDSITYSRDTGNERTEESAQLSMARPGGRNKSSAASPPLAFSRSETWAWEANIYH